MGSNDIPPPHVPSSYHTICMLLLGTDIGLVYSVVKYGENEWKHAQIIGQNIGKILGQMVLWWCWALWALCTWWVDVDNPVNPKEGKIYKGVEGIDTTELGFWTAMVAQVVLSWGLLAQVVVRGNSGGASYAIWTTRFLGSVAGLNGYYAYCWWVWPESHGYFVNPFAVCLWVTWVVADLAYLFMLGGVKRTEIVLKSGRKLRGEVEFQSSKGR